MDRVGARDLKSLRATPLDKLLAVPTDGGDHVLDGYVIPRLASGLLFAKEVTA